MNITLKNRREAYDAIIPKRENRKEMIIKILRENADGMTAEEIGQKLLDDGKVDRIDPNYTRPRLTELKEAGIVQVVGRRPSAVTGRNTAVWKLAKR